MSFTKLKNKIGYEKVLVAFTIQKIHWKKGPYVQFPPLVHLVANLPPTRKHILLLNKNISLIREYYINVNT